MATYKRIDRGKESIRGLSEKTGLSIATIRRHTSLPRDEWLTKKHSWTQTAEHFGLHVDTVRRRARRARRDRAAADTHEDPQSST